MWFGPKAALTTLVLVAIEVAFSFDNAVINAKTLTRLSPLWQGLFLTVGMLIAIAGMRIIFPILIVTLTAHLGWHQVVDDALHHPRLYAQYLNNAHVSIAAFGAGFLMVLCLNFFLDHKRELVWVSHIERPLRRLGTGTWLAPAVATVVIVSSSFMSENFETVWRAGLLGVVVFSLMNALVNGIALFSGGSGSAKYTGWGAAVAFIYLEVLDASFSFDGVLGAFAITTLVPLIAIGLGVGALWVRSLTIFMVRNKTLSTYRYLEHGAHYAILILAVALLVSIFIHVPDAVTGIAGLGVIIASIIASREANLQRE